MSIFSQDPIDRHLQNQVHEFTKASAEPPICEDCQTNADVVEFDNYFYCNSCQQEVL